MNLIKEHFNSVRELLRVLEGRTNNDVMKGKNSSTEHGENFTGTTNWNEAVDLFETGYTDVLPKIKSVVQKNLKATGNHERRFVRNGVVGYAPNVPNAIQGLPNSMIYTEKQTQKIKAVSIVYAPTGNCGTKAETFIQSGICVLSAINILELSGVRVNLSICLFDGEGGNEGTFVTVKVKDYKEHMDIQKLCFPVVHPSLFRRFGFRWLETSPAITEADWAYGYGCITDEFNYKLKKSMKSDEFFVTLSDTNEIEYSPERLIEKLGIKK